MRHPRPNEVWFNNVSGRNEDIIGVGDRVLTCRYDCSLERFLELYTFNYPATIQTLKDKIDKLTVQLEHTQDTKDAL